MIVFYCDGASETQPRRPWQGFRIRSPSDPQRRDWSLTLTCSGIWSIVNIAILTTKQNVKIMFSEKFEVVSTRVLE